MSSTTDRINVQETEVMDYLQKDPGVVKQWVDDMIPKLLTFAVDLVITIVVLIIGIKLINWFVKIITRSLEKSRMEAGVATFLSSMIRYIMYFFLVMMVLARFGVTTGSVVAMLGSVGLTIGLALQGSLANFAGGVLILVLKPFVVGDYIKTEGEEGTVSEISIFYTKMVNIENHVIVIPNGTLSNSNIVNYTQLEKRLIQVQVGVDYGSDLAKAKEVLEDMVHRDESVLQEEPVRVVVTDLADSSVVFEIRVWVKNEDYWDTRWRITENAKLTLDQNGIQIPFPQVHVVQN